MRTQFLIRDFELQTLFRTIQMLIQVHLLVKL